MSSDNFLSFPGDILLAYGGFGLAALIALITLLRCLCQRLRMPARPVYVGGWFQEPKDISLARSRISGIRTKPLKLLPTWKSSGSKKVS